MWDKLEDLGISRHDSAKVQIGLHIGPETAATTLDALIAQEQP